MKEAAKDGDNKSSGFRRSLSNLQIDSFFSKSAPPSPAHVDGCDEVWLINDSVTTEWPVKDWFIASSSRSSSSDTSKESLFSPQTVLRSRSVSSGSGSRKSPRNSELMMCSPSSQLLSPLPVVQEKDREQWGRCSSLSKKMTGFYINDLLSPTTIMEENM